MERALSTLPSSSLEEIRGKPTVAASVFCMVNVIRLVYQCLSWLTSTLDTLQNYRVRVVSSNLPLTSERAVICCNDSDRENTTSRKENDCLFEVITEIYVENRKLISCYKKYVLS
jgi:hypothetical protein